MSDYTLLVGIIQFLAAVVLFFIVNWIGSKSISVGYIQLSTSIAEDSSPAFNFLFKVIAPPVYLVLYATICQTSNANWLNVNCYLLVIYYWAFRGLFILATGKCRLTNWITFGLYALFSIGISYGIYKVLNDVDKILPDPKDLLNQLWLLIIIFLYNILNKMEFGRDRTIRRKESYLSRQFMVFNTKYGSLVHSKCQNEFLEAIVFAIMIYENFNRPRAVRWIEYARFFLTKKEHTLGIMQVKSRKFINDRESILLAIDYIKDTIKDTEKLTYLDVDGFDWLAGTIADRYNGESLGYDNEVLWILHFITSNHFEHVNEDYLRIVQQTEQTIT